MAYTTTSNLAAALGRSLTAEETTYFNSVLDSAIDAYINGQLGTSFGSTTSGEVYVETDEDQGGTLIIPTMHDITSVAKVNDDDTEEAIPVDDYFTYPRGSENKYALKHKNGQWEGDATYKITGELGYKTVPADITAVATEMALSSLTANVNNYKSEKVGDWAVTYADSSGNPMLSQDSLAILDSYRRLSRSI